MHHKTIGKNVIDVIKSLPGLVSFITAETAVDNPESICRLIGNVNTREGNRAL